MKKETAIKTVLSLLLAGLCLVSVLWAPKHLTDPAFYSETIAHLDEKKTTVMELTAASAAASAAITVLPDDVGSPIANKLTDLSSGFLLVICAIYLEKYLLTITGYAACYVLFPVACGLGLAWVWFKNRTMASAALKMALLGAVLVMVIPVSVKVSGIIEETYNTSIQQTIESATDAPEEIEQESKKWSVSGLISGIQTGVSDAVTNAQNKLNSFLEALAVMLVTSCLIPVLVLVFFVWIIKVVLGIHIPLPRTAIALPAGRKNKDTGTLTDTDLP